MIRAAKLLAMTGVDLLMEPTHLIAAKRAFEAQHMRQSRE
jgi:flagellar basal body rod protein FlgC